MNIFFLTILYQLYRTLKNRSSALFNGETYGISAHAMPNRWSYHSTHLTLLETITYAALLSFNDFPAGTRPSGGICFLLPWRVHLFWFPGFLFVEVVFFLNQLFNHKIWVKDSMSHHFKLGVFYMKNMEFGMTLLVHNSRGTSFFPRNSNCPIFGTDVSYPNKVCGLFALTFWYPRKHGFVKKSWTTLFF